jgi:hypothetical protein
VEYRVLSLPREGVDHEIGDHGNDQQHHDRLEVAAADANQRLVAAAGGEHHADAEQQAAEHVLEPDEIVLAIGREGAGDVHHASCFEAHHAEHAHRDSQHPGAHAPGVTHVDPVGHRAHGAEVGFVGHGPHDQRDHKGRPQEERLGAGKIFVNHDSKLSRDGECGAWRAHS